MRLGVALVNGLMEIRWKHQLMRRLFKYPPYIVSSFIHIFPVVGGLVVLNHQQYCQNMIPFIGDINDIHLINDMNHPPTCHFPSGVFFKPCTLRFFFRHAPWAQPKTSVKTTRSFGTLWKPRCFCRGSFPEENGGIMGLCSLLDMLDTWIGPLARWWT